MLRALLRAVRAEFVPPGTIPQRGWGLAPVPSVTPRQRFTRCAANGTREDSPYVAGIPAILTASTLASSPLRLIVPRKRTLKSLRR